MMFCLVVGKKHEKNTRKKMVRKNKRNAFCLNLDGKSVANTFFFGWVDQANEFLRTIFRVKGRVNRYLTWRQLYSPVSQTLHLETISAIEVL